MKRLICCFSVIHCAWISIFLSTVGGDYNYIVPEECKRLYVIGNIANDIGLDVKRLSSRKARIETEDTARQYCTINLNNGNLVVTETIDREELCRSKISCVLNYELVLENPFDVHRISLQVQDINDNAPRFPSDVITFNISESATKGERFTLDEAHDPDIGQNMVQSYSLERNKYFALLVNENAEGKKSADLVLEKQLDREHIKEINIKIFATDGGNPQRSGSANIHINVLDANDNSPIFSQSIYKVALAENAPLDTNVLTVTAVDADEGGNGKVSYKLIQMSDKESKVFVIDSQTGQIKVHGNIDFEEETTHEIRVQAKDGPGLVSTAKVIIEIIDVNDNIPRIVVKSIYDPIPENAPLNTEVALLNVQDKDSGDNRKISCFISQHVPFKINQSIKNYFSLVTTSILDREKVSHYNITIIATDGGLQPLSSSSTIYLSVSDVNDNPPVFEQQTYSAYIKENNKPGTTICFVTAKDLDWQQNGTVLYSLLFSEVDGVAITSFLSINAETGLIQTIKSFDYETFKNLKVQVLARDNGSPPISSNVTVNIIITDENDNVPHILYPAPEGKSVMTELVPKTALAGSLISKVIAVDADSGQNSWLSYHIVKATDPGLFAIGLYSGEITALRDITKTDTLKQNLVILVKDNGQPLHTATCSVNLLISDHLAEIAEFKDMIYEDSKSALTFYLIIVLISMSTLFLTFIIVIVAVSFCHRRKPSILFDGAVAIPSTYLPPNYAEVEGTGTLRSSYNYDGYLTTGSHTSDFKFFTSYNDNTLKASVAMTESPDNSSLSLLDACHANEVST